MEPAVAPVAGDIITEPAPLLDPSALEQLANLIAAESKSLDEITAVTEQSEPEQASSFSADRVFQLLQHLPGAKPSTEPPLSFLSTFVSYVLIIVTAWNVAEMAVDAVAEARPDDWREVWAATLRGGAPVNAAYPV
jgi:hypothetical protein